jgi:hypothetical protein
VDDKTLAEKRHRSPEEDQAHRSQGSGGPRLPAPQTSSRAISSVEVRAPTSQGEG